MHLGPSKVRHLNKCCLFLLMFLSIKTTCYMHFPAKFSSTFRGDKKKQKASVFALRGELGPVVSLRKRCWPFQKGRKMMRLFILWIPENLKIWLINRMAPVGSVDRPPSIVFWPLIKSDIYENHVLQHVCGVPPPSHSRKTQQPKLQPGLWQEPLETIPKCMKTFVPPRIAQMNQAVLASYKFVD